MAPTSQSGLPLSTAQTKASQAVDVDIAEAWGEGFQFGGLIILMLVVICNIKRHVLLHKLILIEVQYNVSSIQEDNSTYNSRQQFLALWHATFIFFDDPIYGCEALGGIGQVSMHTFKMTETLINEHLDPREPWWIFTTVYFVWVIKRGYSRGFWELAKASSRFGVLSFCMVASIAFAIVDAVLVFRNWDNSTGINPFWRISLVLKCASDTIFLDDFKKFLDSLVIKPFNNIGSQAQFHRGHELRTHDFVNLSSETECHNAIPNSSHQEFATYHSATIKDGPKNGSSKDIYRAVASPPHSPN
ncbi:hypothetical protein QQS21_001972 [Conoideocrella luteorostrata]|uniref:Uncharacterized protein n=1 Tax=Conoideocrella luteorostrata TaxID=1105319 RepID=A0AAJ0CZZ0_9HYPO|nr:hypothetical protein QQS21_001972 [Conoideocrella luteorostrata]